MRHLLNVFTLSIRYYKCHRYDVAHLFVKYVSCQFWSQKKIFSTMSNGLSTTIFQGTGDRYEGVLVDSEVEHCDLSEFANKLEESLKVWKNTQRRTIWFRVDLKNSEWIPILARNGFNFHHAKPGFVMMYQWLSPETCRVPVYAHTMVGVGAVVVNDKNQVLVVQEKRSPTGVALWKLPGGYVEPSENIIDAVIREVEEETGIKTEFRSMLSMRHTPISYQFGCSDIYIIMHMVPKSTDITKCDDELVACEWMDVEEYRSHPHIHELNKSFLEKYLTYQNDNLKIECVQGSHPFLRRPYSVFSALREDN